jgi:LacI family transcriptional regulator
MAQNTAQPPRVTIQDVARLAQVSVATVSAVINGNVRVSDERSERVRSAMAALRYRPDERGRMLRTGRSRILGVVVPDLTNPFYPEIVREIEREARARRYSVLLCDSASDVEQERMHLEALLDRRVDGALVACTDSATSYEWLRERRMRALFFERIPLAGRFAAVSTDHTAAAAEATRHLLGLRHRRIAFLATDPDLSSNSARLRAFRDVLAGHGIAVPPRLVVTGLQTVEEARAATTDLLARAARPTALLCSNSVLLLGAARAAREAGLRCPADVSLMCFDNPEWTAHFAPALTTRAQATATLAAAAVERLIDSIEHPENVREETVWVADRLVLRESTGPAPRRK